MPRQTLRLNRFEAEYPGAVPEHRLPEGGARRLEDVDLASATVRGRQGDVAASGTAFDRAVPVRVRGTVGGDVAETEATLYVNTDAAARIALGVDNVNGSEIEQAPEQSPSSIAGVLGRAVAVEGGVRVPVLENGRPAAPLAAVGLIAYFEDQFDENALFVTRDEADTIDPARVSTSTEDGGVTPGQTWPVGRYRYALSLVYDDGQESALYEVPGAFDVVASDPSETRARSVVVNAYTADTGARLLSIRATAFKVYRNFAPVYTTEVLGSYYLVGRVDIPRSAPISQVVPLGPIPDLTFPDTEPDAVLTATHEGESGLPLGLATSHLRYGCCAWGSGFLFAGDVVNPGVENEEGDYQEDWDRYVVRSQAFSPDVFDWSEDFCTLEARPLALAWSQGRLWAFTAQACHRIEPVSMVVEATFGGYGVLGRLAITEALGTIWWATADGLAFVTASGEPRIVPQTGRGWLDPIYNRLLEGLTLGAVVLEADETRGQVLAGVVGSDTLWCLSAARSSIQPSRLGRLTLAQTVDDVVVPQPLMALGRTAAGRALASVAAYGTAPEAVLVLQQAQPRRPWLVESRPVDLGEPVTPKKFYEAFAHTLAGQATNLPVLTVATNGNGNGLGGFVALEDRTTPAPTGLLHRIPESVRKARALVVRASGQADDRMEMLSLVLRDYRTKPGNPNTSTDS